MLDSARSIKYTEEEIATVVDVMQHADPLTQGKYQDEFERKFERYIGTSRAFAISNCTCALELSALLSGLTPKDEVIIPAHTFCATAIPFARTGAKIVWADIDPETRVVSRETIEPLITEKTKVIVPVHLYGLMAPMPEIMDMAIDRDILVVEDCAQAIGSSINGKRAGTFGDFSCFSFHTHKNITTLGEGGMLVVRDEGLAKLVPGLRHNGIRSFGERREYWKPAMSNVDMDIDCVLPYNFCLGEVQCALGSKLIERVDALNDLRNRRAKRFVAFMETFPELSFQRVPEGYYHNYHLLSARYDGRWYQKTNSDLIERLAYTYRIKAIVQYYPLYRYPMFQKLGFGKANCPNTDRFFDSMISFPFHSWMSDYDFEIMMYSVWHALEDMRSESCGIFG
jgi:perosamine synthetase